MDHIATAALSSLRWSVPPAERQQTDSILLALPTCLGGLGLASFALTSPHAWAAADECATASLSALIPAIQAPASISSQKEKCENMFYEMRGTLLDSLDNTDKMVLVENPSAIGRRWLSIIPSLPLLRLTDTQVALALRFRTLDRPAVTTCRSCGVTPLPPLHSESCTRTQRHRTGRHEVVKYALGRALQMAPNSEVTYEPLIFDRAPGAARFNDVRFSGSPEADLGPMEFNVKVTGLQSERHRVWANARFNDPDPFVEAKENAVRALDEVSRATTGALPTMGSTAASFHPFVLSAGGLTDRSTTRLLASLRQKLGPGVLSFMTQTIGIGLVKRRTDAMARVEGYPARRL